MLHHVMNKSSLFWITIIFFTVAGVFGLSQSGYTQETTDIVKSNISGDVEAPRRHVRFKHSQRLTTAQAKQLYEIYRDALWLGYGLSGHEALSAGRPAMQFNIAPYRSSSHGNHYLNNYTNPAGADYGLFEKASTFESGAILFKDSFSVGESGAIILGPLFIMEKMKEGFSPVSGDWKYIQIQPTGELLGETNGRGEKKVQYCISCHLSKEKQDHLYFIPEEYRASE